MIYDILYENLKKRLTNLTPLPFDCGRLCDCACCKGDEESGMYLFPFEEKFYDKDENFTVTKSELLLSSGKNVLLLSCKNSCDRKKRPISCMIFPFFPYYKKGSDVKVIPDPRANGICPLLSPNASAYIQNAFLREIELFGRYLAKTKEGADFLESVSLVLDDYLKFYKNKEPSL